MEETRRTVPEAMLGQTCDRCNRFLKVGEEIIVKRYAKEHVVCAPDETFNNRKSAYPPKDFQEWDPE